MCLPKQYHETERKGPQTRIFLKSLIKKCDFCNRAAVKQNPDTAAAATNPLNSTILTPWSFGVKKLSSQGRPALYVLKFSRAGSWKLGGRTDPTILIKFPLCCEKQNYSLLGWCYADCPSGCPETVTVKAMVFCKRCLDANILYFIIIKDAWMSEYTTGNVSFLFSKKIWALCTDVDLEIIYWNIEPVAFWAATFCITV